METEAAAEPAAVGDYVEKVTPSLADFHLRDNDAVYADDDEDSVVTMYLTVREGNSAEHTDHTWTEINTYSKYCITFFGPLHQDHPDVEGFQL